MQKPLPNRRGSDRSRDHRERCAAWALSHATRDTENGA